MNQGFGMEAPTGHEHSARRKAARYLVIVDAGGSALARLFSESREQIAEFDASTEETTSMTSGQTATRGASGPEWDRALASHNAQERAAALVYHLTV